MLGFVIHYVWFLSICVTRHLHDGLQRAVACETQTYFRLSLVPPTISDSRKYVCVRRQRELSWWLKKWLISGNLAIWTVYVFVLYQCLLVPRGINSRFCGKTQWQMFLLVSGRQHIVSIQISINSGKNSFLRNLAYLPSFTSQILDFIYWKCLICILIYFEWHDTENQQYVHRSH